MPNGINLIPEAEVQKQQKTRVIKVSSILSIIILVLACLLGFYITYQNTLVKNDIEAAEAEIESLRGQIRQMEEVEVIARNLDSKYKVLNQVFNDRPNYSLLLREINNRKPEALRIENMDTKGNSLNITGSATDYISIKTYVDNLLNLNNSFSGGIPGLENVFTSVTINSVNLDSATGNVKYFIVAEVDLTKLRK